MNWQALPRPISARFYVTEGDNNPITLVFAFWAMCPEQGLIYMTPAGNITRASRLRNFQIQA